MAITKRVITTIGEMAQFLEDSGFFAEVEVGVDENDRIKTVACKDADGNTVFSLLVNGTTAAYWYGYASAENRVEEYITASGGVSCNAYSTAKGLLFANPAGNGSACVVSKTNNGAYCVLLPALNKNISGTYASAKQKVIAWGDTAPFDRLVTSGVAFSNVSQTSATPYEWNQTIKCPIPTQSEYGTPSYFADAFFLPVSQYRYETVFEIDGVKYVTDGYVCLRDE